METDRTRMNRRTFLAKLGAAGVVLAAGSANLLPSKVFAATTYTPNLKLKKSDPLVVTDMNDNFERIDSEFANRAVTPDFYKIGTGTDDTQAVQDAFNSGRTVVFTRSYNVRSVEISADNQTVDFNGYYLFGISAASDSAADKDAILKITGRYLNLFNVFVYGNYNTAYKCGIHWYSQSASHAAQHNTVFGMFISRVLVGLQFGSHYTDVVTDAPQSENLIYGFRTREVQNCLNCYQPNGVLKMIGGIFDCNQYAWSSAFDNNLATAFEVKPSASTATLTIVSSEILKTASNLGYGFKGKDFQLLDCAIEVATHWGYLQGDAVIRDVTGGYLSQLDRDLFTIEAGSAGRLLLDNIVCRRPAGGLTSTAALIAGFGSAPGYSAVLDNAQLTEWSAQRIADSRRDLVRVTNSTFSVSGTSTRVCDRLQGAVNWAESVDTTGEQMSQAADMSTKAGWSGFSVSGSGNYFRKTTASMPAGFRSAIEISANGAGNNLYASSAKFPVVPEEPFAFQTQGKISAATAGNDTLVKVIWFKENGTSLSSTTPQTVLLSNASGAGQLSNAWKEYYIEGAVPADAYFAMLQAGAQGNGSAAVTLALTGLELFSLQTKYLPSLMNRMNAALNYNGSGLILKSPNGTPYRITVSDAGAITVTAV
ncbi:twin-arginine translocation signal domain-containing protein [Cohnella rhizosphaerae]|uniref:Twin-arginine translocation signal domain-containing protein n=1 Tax=Cohnella rhizosphaerae TaxID=1457232 RepID=A0A9X4QVG8_9BACL|nr:twin-arginine translocation signal domain-containing protein [Cohnella rhizosphaerae]MDG0812725.1 twin-arginine translocation signal domain-containing protein [Cohnella rhizosphaerae]